MAFFEISLRRLIIAGGFAVAVAAAPAIAVVATPAAGPAYAENCPGGEEGDPFTGVCVPHTVPNSPSPFGSIAGNPSIPEVDNIPCTGANSGQCIGLAEEQESEGPAAVPRSTVGSSPTITGGPS